MDAHSIQCILKKRNIRQSSPFQLQHTIRSVVVTYIFFRLLLMSYISDGVGSAHSFVSMSPAYACVVALRKTRFWGMSWRCWMVTVTLTRWMRIPSCKGVKGRSDVTETYIIIEGAVVSVSCGWRIFSSSLLKRTIRFCSANMEHCLRRHYITFLTS